MFILLKIKSSKEDFHRNKLLDSARLALHCKLFVIILYRSLKLFIQFHFQVMSKHFDTRILFFVYSKIQVPYTNSSKKKKNKTTKNVKEILLIYRSGTLVKTLAQRAD